MSKKTTKIIVGGGNDYVIQVKNNQKGLLKRVRDICETEKAVDYCETQETSRGRVVKRVCRIYEETSGIDPGWIGLKRIIQLTRSGTRKGKEFKEIHYYISSKAGNDASYFAAGIRAHWGIENRLHWVKEAIFNEDKCRIRTPSIVSNLSLIRACVINTFRAHKMSSLTKAIEKYTNRIEECLVLIEKFDMSIN